MTDCCCCCYFSIISVVIGLFVCLKLYNKFTTGVYKGKEKLNGKTVVVTGANSGIGFVCAKDFAQRGARVIMVCRDMTTAEQAKRDIIESTGNRNIILKHINFISLTSVRKCANEIAAEEPRIDILLNNAGLGSINLKQSEDGINKLMQINYFGPFLFTNILLGKIKQASPSRIVNVSSILHKRGEIILDKIKESYTQKQYMYYNNSKLGNILFSNELARLLKGTGVTVNSLHPGVFGSEIARNSPYGFSSFYKFFASAFFKSVEEGAQTSLYCCLSPDLENVTGKYFVDCKMRDPSKAAQDMAIAKKLWEVSEQIVKLQDDEKHYY